MTARIYLILLTLFISHSVYGQQNFALKGKVIDETTDQELIGATIWLETQQKGTITDVNGQFHLEVSPQENYSLIISYIGFVSDTIIVDPKELSFITIELSEGLELQEVVISNKFQKATDNYNKTRMGYADLSIEEVNMLPALLSENDVLKAIQLLPGIQSSEGAATGYYVRGGSSDQNLILLNGATVYNPFHAAGFISIFNGDLVEDIEIFKSGMPANFGGRLSSLLNVTTKEPSFTEFNGNAGIGLVTAKLTTEIPIVKNKLSILLSGRAFYSYSLFRALASDQLKESLPKYYFYDAFGQINWKVNDKNDVSFYSYNGKDLVSFQDQSTSDSTAFDIPWSNQVLGGNWQYKMREKIILDVNAYHSKYNFFFGANYASGGQSLATRIRESGGSINISHVAKNHYLTYGVSSQSINIIPEVTKDVLNNTNGQSTRITDLTESFRPIHTNIYFNDDWSINEKFGLNYGIRLGLFKEGNQYYNNFDPTIVARYNVTDNSSIKASYSYAKQFVHLLVNSTSTTPLDLWVTSTKNIKPQNAHAVSLGWFQNFKENKYEFSVESYYRKLGNQIEYKEGVDVFSEQALDTKLLAGQGFATGAEFLIRKRQGRLTGFAGYTLAWSQRQFDELNDGLWYDYKFDRRHDLTISLNYKLNDRWSVAALFVLGTGHTITVPENIYYTPKNQGNGNFFIDYGEKNSYRLKNYHRLDVSLAYTGKPKKVQSSFKLDIYNVYNRSNAFFVLLTSENSGNRLGSEISLREYSLIPILPSVSYQLAF